MKSLDRHNGDSDVDHEDADDNSNDIAQVLKVLRIGLFMHFVQYRSPDVGMRVRKGDRC